MEKHRGEQFNHRERLFRPLTAMQTFNGTTKKIIFLGLSHINLASFLWDIGKQYSPRTRRPT